MNVPARKETVREILAEDEEQKKFKINPSRQGAASRLISLGDRFDASALHRPGYSTRPRAMPLVVLSPMNRRTAIQTVVSTVVVGAASNATATADGTSKALAVFASRWAKAKAFTLQVADAMPTDKLHSSRRKKCGNMAS